MTNGPKYSIGTAVSEYQSEADLKVLLDEFFGDAVYDDGQQIDCNTHDSRHDDEMVERELIWL